MIFVEVYFFEFRNWREEIDVLCNAITSSDIRLNYCIPMNHRPGVIIHIVLDDLYRISSPKKTQQ